MKVLLIILLLFSTGCCLGQSGIIRGNVSEKPGNTPVPFATVRIQGQGIGTTTDDNGTYVIDKLAPGQYNIEVTSVGFKKQTVFEIQVTSSRPAIVDVILEQESQQLEVVEVDATATFFKTDESPVSLRTIGTTEIKRTPGGNRDISKVIRSLPGVSSPPSFRNDIIIRGGAPSENTFYLDGIQIPVINHFQTQGSSGGPVGMINVDLLREVNFYSGAFPSNRGNTLSSVFDFQLKDPRKDKWTFNGVLGATDLGVTLEGPVSDNSSLVVSARRSYLKYLFSVFNLPFLPVYNDLQFKYKIDIDKRNQLTFLGIAAVDDFSLNFDAPENADTEEERQEALYILRVLPVTTQWNYTTGVRYQHFRSGGATSFFLSTNKLNNDIIKYRENDNSTPDNLIQAYNSQETEFRFRVEDYSQTRNGTTLTFGLSAEQGNYDTDEFVKIVTQSGALIRDYQSNLSVLKWGAFGQVSKSFVNDKLTMSFGLRADANDYSDEMSDLLDQLSPRFSASYDITDRISANFNTGIYYQLPAYTILGFRRNNELINKTNEVRYIRSTHLVGGFELNLKRNARITLEGFYKKYSQYPFQLDDSISLANLGADFGTIGNAPITSTSSGNSYGAEFLLQQKLFKDYYGLLSYTWVRSQFRDKNDELVPTAWDNRHLISLTGGKRFKRNWEVGFRFLFTGGAPYTPYNVAKTVRKENWDVRYFGVFDYNRLNTKRIEPFHQLDLRIDKKYFFTRWSLNVYLDVQNVYNYTAEFQDEIDIQRDPAGNPITDPDNPEAYLPRFFKSGYGTILPTIGLIIEL